MLLGISLNELNYPMCIALGCKQPGEPELGGICLDCYETRLFDGEHEGSFHDPMNWQDHV